MEAQGTLRYEFDGSSELLGELLLELEPAQAERRAVFGRTEGQQKINVTGFRGLSPCHGPEKLDAGCVREQGRNDDVSNLLPGNWVDRGRIRHGLLEGPRNEQFSFLPTLLSPRPLSNRLVVPTAGATGPPQWPPGSQPTDSALRFGVADEGVKHFPASHRVGVADHDRLPAGAGEGHVEAPRLVEEADLAAPVAADERDQHHLLLPPLKAVDRVDLHRVGPQPTVDPVHLVVVGGDEGHVGRGHARRHQVGRQARHEIGLARILPRVGPAALPLGGVDAGGVHEHEWGLGVEGHHHTGADAHRLPESQRRKRGRELPAQLHPAFHALDGYADSTTRENFIAQANLIGEFETAFDMSDPNRGVDQRLSATVASYPDQPVALAEPQDGGWLADRIAEFGPRPIGYLLGFDGDRPPAVDDAADDSFLGRSVGWLSITEPVGRRYIGVVPADE